MRKFNVKNFRKHEKTCLVSSKRKTCQSALHKTINLTSVNVSSVSENKISEITKKLGMARRSQLFDHGTRALENIGTAVRWYTFFKTRRAIPSFFVISGNCFRKYEKTCSRREFAPDETRQVFPYVLNDILFRLSTEIPRPQVRRTAQHEHSCGWHLLV